MSNMNRFSKTKSMYMIDKHYTYVAFHKSCLKIHYYKFDFYLLFQIYYSVNGKYFTIVIICQKKSPYNMQCRCLEWTCKKHRDQSKHNCKFDFQNIQQKLMNKIIKKLLHQK